jgi:glucose-6-phosphate isomerase
MLSLDLGNIYIDYKDVAPVLATLRDKKSPDFCGYRENLAALKKALLPYKGLSNLIIIGHGGSVNSFKALRCVAPDNKRVAVLSTNEPDCIARLRKEFPKKSTLVMPISKSGTNITVLESLLAFEGYNTLVVTENKSNPLRQMAEKKGWKIINHPEIGGRYAGISSCAYAPLLFLGVEVRKIDSGAKAMYRKCGPPAEIEENPALQLAVALFLLELKGYSEVFMPIYSAKMACFLPLIVQLMHESVCKSGVGQTFYGGLAPESQHHTNQRFFGGRKNVVGLFVRVKEFTGKDLRVRVAPQLGKISLMDASLQVLDNIPYAKALDFEFQGVREHTIHYKIPYSVITLDKVDEYTSGEFMAFWHYVAIYSSWLRNVNPFDQPEVEFSKRHSFELRKKFRA